MKREVREVAQLSFDYASLDIDTRAFLVERAERIRHYGKRAAESIVKIGEELVAAKARLAHGQWLPWLDAEFGWSVDTAGRFMSVHGLAGQIPQIAEYTIDISALYLLAAPSTPQPVIEEAVERAASGQRVTHASVVEMKQRVAERMGGGNAGWSPRDIQPKPEPVFTYEEIGYQSEDHFAYQGEVNSWLKSHPFSDPAKIEMLVKNAQDHWRPHLATLARSVGTILIDLAENP